MLYVLDSDHLSLHQRGFFPLQFHLLRIPPEQIAITIVSVEELLRGRLAQIRRSADSENRVKAYYWLSKTLDYVCHFSVLPYDSHAEAYFQTLRARKIRIGVQDLKIAAITLCQNATLVTRNERDFKRISELHIENWSISV